jgi:serine phosphatase RsbU (regulator of sigma subunit)
MTFSISTVKLINILFIAAGIGVCGLCFLQITSSTHLRKEVRRYFQVFFLVLVLYIGTHLARELMDGLPGAGVSAALRIVTFVEVLSAGGLAFLMSMLILSVAQPEKHGKPLQFTLLALLGLHAVLLIVGVLTDVIYYFDGNNVYHRGSAYLLSNLAPLVMLVIDVVLMVRNGKKMDRRVATAFWVYLIAPIGAIVIQGFTYGLQLIIFATVGAAVYMFSVIIRDLNTKYEKQQAESSRLETELSLATRIQADMLPNIFPAFPERKEFDIYASMDPAKEVGGDFYDFFFVDDDHLGIVMADVSGKGVPAALFMMISKILAQNYAMTGRGPKETLEAVNAQICANNREEMFVTIWLGLLDLNTGRLIAANAGHEYPVLKPADGSFELVKDKHGFVVGGMPGVKYRDYELQLAPGAKLFLYTDGVAEATNADNELFGTDRMIEALRAAEEEEPKKIVEAVDHAVAEFVKDAPQFDDLTMLCLHFKGKDAESTKEV